MKQKGLRKLVSMILAVVMVLGVCGSALAADTIVNNVSDHTFTAYQIFTGTQSSDTGTALGDIEWGDNINPTNFLSALITYTYEETAIFASCMTAQDVANVLDDYGNNSEVAKAFAALAVNYITGEGTSITAGESTLEPGYYLIVDTTTTLSKGDAYNAALLQVTGGGTITITEKTDSPTVDKFVDDADTQIGGTVTFTLTGSVPDMTYNETYTYIFHDTLSSNLDYVENSLKVYGVNSSGEKTEIESGYSTTTSSGDTITVSFADLKTLSGIDNYDYIVVVYDATLNNNATVGQTTDNSNTVYLEYSNKPDDSNSTGDTAPDVVYVFTYKLEGTKVDATDNTKTLSGAEFVLYYVDGETTYYAVLNDDGKVTGWTTCLNETDDGYTEGEDELASTITSGTNGTFSVSGLGDDVTYYLQETKAPAGYNLLIDPIAIVIEETLVATVDNGTDTDDLDTISSLTISVDNKTAVNGTTETGAVAITVENNAGSTLPSTGGVGTTIFYIIGGVLVAGAAVLLVTKKRLGKME